MDSLLWIFTAFFCGSLPFSVWLSQIFLGVDVRQYGDGNPGATNVFRAGSPLLGLITLLLDISKAAIPVGLSYANLNLRGLPMIVIALAPILGHMFSPFLRFKGGKALATALGVWIGLTIWRASLPAVVGVLVGTMILSTSGWGVMFAMGIILLFSILWSANPLLWWIWLGQTLLLGWSHREDLKHLPSVNPQVIRILRKNKD
jgi:glycerol-3-phosphate acyltransferase PlsY